MKNLIIRGVLKFGVVAKVLHRFIIFLQTNFFKMKIQSLIICSLFFFKWKVSEHSRKMSRHRSVKKSAKSAIINMNPKVILERMSDPKVQSLQRTSLIKNNKLELLDFEENNLFECPFCDYEEFSKM